MQSIQTFLRPIQKYQVNIDGTMEINVPLSEMAVDENLKGYLGKAFAECIAEKSTIASLEDIKDFKFTRIIGNDKELYTSIKFKINDQQYIVPKDCIQGFIGYFFNNVDYSKLIKKESSIRMNQELLEEINCTEDFEFQLLHNNNNEVFGWASPKYQQINTYRILNLIEQYLPEIFESQIEVQYKFGRQYGFHGRIFDKNIDFFKEVGDIRKFFHLFNLHSGKNAFNSRIGIERLECTNGATSMSGGNCRFIHMTDDDSDLMEYVIKNIDTMHKGFSKLYCNIENSPETYYEYPAVETLIKNLPKIPKRIDQYLWNGLKSRTKNNELRAFDVHYVLSDVATNHLLNKVQHYKLNIPYMETAGLVLSPTDTYRKIKDILHKEDKKENEEEVFNVPITSD